MSANSSFSDPAGIRCDYDTCSESSLVLEQPICEHFTQLCREHRKPLVLETYEQMDGFFNKRVEFLRNELDSDDLLLPTEKFFKNATRDRMCKDFAITEFIFTPVGLTFYGGNTVQLDVPSKTCGHCKEIFEISVEDLEDFFKSSTNILDIEVKPNGVGTFRKFAKKMPPQFFANIESGSFVFMGQVAAEPIQRITKKCPKMTCLRIWHQSHQEVNVWKCIQKMKKIEHLELHYPDGRRNYGYKMLPKFLETLAALEKKDGRPLRTLVSYNTRYLFNSKDVLKCTSVLARKLANQRLGDSQNFMKIVNSGYLQHKNLIIRFNVQGFHEQMGAEWENKVKESTNLHHFQSENSTTWYSSNGSVFLFQEE